MEPEAGKELIFIANDLAPKIPRLMVILLVMRSRLQPLRRT